MKQDAQILKEIRSTHKAHMKRMRSKFGNSCFSLGGTITIFDMVNGEFREYKL